MAADLRLALILGLTGCGPSWVVVSDLHGGGWFIADAASGAVAVDRSLAADFPDACLDGADRYCLIYQSRHRVDLAGHDEVVVTFSPAGLPDDADPHDPTNNGQIVGYRVLDPPEITWHLDRLDWSEVDPGQRICRSDPADPCRPAPETSAEEAQACALFWPHDVHVQTEDTSGLHLIVADTRNKRVLWINTTPGSTCGRVTDVLNGVNPDWDVYTSVNAVDPWEDDAGRHLLLSIKDTLGDDAQQTGDGRGKIVQFTDGGAGWAQDWEFPPASTTEASFVNAPHGVTHDADHVYFAHSLGRSEVFNDGLGGSIGVLGRDGTYRYDGVIPTRRLLFPRDTTPVPGGHLVVVDSGEKGSTLAPALTALYVVDLPADPPAPDGDGVWTADHARQSFVAVDLRNHPDTAGRWVLYSADPVTPGADLAERLGTTDP